MSFDAETKGRARLPSPNRTRAVQHTADRFLTKGAAGHTEKWFKNSAEVTTHKGDPEGDAGATGHNPSLQPDFREKKTTTTTATT